MAEHSYVYAECRLCRVSFFLSVTCKPYMLSVVAPYNYLYVDDQLLSLFLGRVWLGFV